MLATLTSDVGRILSKLHQVYPNGDINLHTGIRIAHVILLFFPSVTLLLIISSTFYLVGVEASPRKKP